MDCLPSDDSSRTAERKRIAKKTQDVCHEWTLLQAANGPSTCCIEVLSYLALQQLTLCKNRCRFAFGTGQAIRLSLPHRCGFSTCQNLRKTRHSLSKGMAPRTDSVAQEGHNLECGSPSSHKIDAGINPATETPPREPCSFTTEHRSAATEKCDVTTPRWLPAPSTSRPGCTTTMDRTVSRTERPRLFP